jgi:hypothetical protein
VRTVTITVLAALVASCATEPPPVNPELQASLALYGRVFDETEDPFEARRQAKAQYAVFYAHNPEFSRRLDMLTALMWTLGGGEHADAVCHMRGFEFGTTHHEQCVYEVKMEGRTGIPAIGASSRTPTPGGNRPSAAIMGRVEQGGKVYDPSECIGPVIMGRCQGQILPNKANHPTCYGAWLNGRCTGPMF